MGAAIFVFQVVCSALFNLVYSERLKDPELDGVHYDQKGACLGKCREIYHFPTRATSLRDKWNAALVLAFVRNVSNLCTARSLALLLDIIDATLLMNIYDYLDSRSPIGHNQKMHVNVSILVVLNVPYFTTC